jgi:heterodisulfide reductase subunit C
MREGRKKEEKRMLHTSNQSETTSSADLEDLKEMLRACIQCGTCSASCPNAFAMDLTPRRLWRMVLMGCSDAIFSSHTFALCSACYYCTLRCPRGLPLTDAMAALKQVAARKGISRYRRSTLFYETFMESVRRHGRVREMEFMSLYFTRMKNPLLPLEFASLGLKLMARGKTPLQIPSKGTGKLEAIFRKVEEMEIGA